MDRPQFKTIRRAYGFDEIAIVPGDVTVNPDQTSTELHIGEVTLKIPIFAAALDALVSAKTAVLMSELGGLAVLNLEGLQTRYDRPDEVLEEIAKVTPKDATTTLQKVYSAPIQDKYVADRVREIKRAGALCAVSMTPATTKRLAAVAVEAGADIIVVQSTVTTARHLSRSLKGLQLAELVQELGSIPVLVGNTVDYQATLELMETGVAGILVGVGPGAACTSREVLGIGIPQITASIDTAFARDEYFERTGRYVPIITDGGLRTGGDVSKLMCAGADAVMIGSPFAGTIGAPGRGFHWGMATPNQELPRGVRVKIGQTHSIETLLFGPTSKTDGTENLVGALRTSMATCGAQTIQEFHDARMIIAPSIKTEGKIYQMAQTRPAGI